MFGVLYSMARERFAQMVKSSYKYLPAHWCPFIRIFNRSGTGTLYKMKFYMHLTFVCGLSSMLFTYFSTLALYR